MNQPIAEIVPIAQWLRELGERHLTESGSLTEEGNLALKTSFQAGMSELSDKEAQAEFDDRADAVARWLINLERAILGCKDEIAYITKRKKMLEETFASVKETTRQTMFARGIKKAGSTHTLQRVGTAGHLEVIDHGAVPDKFKRIELVADCSMLGENDIKLLLAALTIPGITGEVVVSKTKTRAAMKTEIVPGVEIIPGETLRFRQSSMAPEASE